MSNKKKQNTNSNVKKSNMVIMILAVLLAAFAIFSIANNNQKQAVSTVTDKPTATEEKSKVSDVNIPSNIELKLLKSEISSEAKFYPYKAGDTYMEVVAVKATDGSIRTALNTCQVCYDSGYGYYEQQGDRLVCQNCGNTFRIDDVEKIKGGCNPVPVLQENKTEDGEFIAISKEFLESNKDLFANWKKQ